MPDPPQTPTATRYSLRVRTPRAEPEPTPAPVATPTKRKRVKAPASARKAGRRASAPTTPRGRGKATTTRRRSGKAAEAEAEAGTSEEEEPEDEDVVMFGSKQKHPSANYSESEASEAPTGQASRTPRQSRRGEKRGSTPARKGVDKRKAAPNLTKYDAFNSGYLDAVAEILSSLAVDDQANAEKFEQMKMCDALKMCGYNLDVANLGSAPISEVYHLLSWAVHPAGPCPPLSATAKGVLLKVFASIGSRFREETKDMAAYQRRNALRKLIQASEASQKDDDDNDAAARSPSDPAVRRNPLKIPPPLIDIWKEPYKKATNSAGHESPGSDA